RGLVPGRAHLFFFSSRRRHTRFSRDWSSDVCSSDLAIGMMTRMKAPSLERPSIMAASSISRGISAKKPRIIQTTRDRLKVVWAKIGRAPCRERGQSAEVVAELDQE